VTYNFTASYTVVSVNSTTYEVNVLDVLPTQTYSTTVWFLNDGTVVRLDLAGHTFTGASAGTHFQTYFAPWEVDIVYGQEISAPTSLTFFHSTGTSPVTVGPTSFTVTNYAPNVLPETITACSGASITLNSGSLSVGTPNGSSYPLITYLAATGSETGTSGTTTYSFTSQITSVTVAS